MSQSKARADARAETPPSVWILAAGHAFVQNLRRGHYDIATHVPARHQLRTAFAELAVTI